MIAIRPADNTLNWMRFLSSDSPLKKSPYLSFWKTDDIQEVTHDEFLFEDTPDEGDDGDEPNNTDKKEDPPSKDISSHTPETIANQNTQTHPKQVSVKKDPTSPSAINSCTIDFFTPDKTYTIRSCSIVPPEIETLSLIHTRDTDDYHLNIRYAHPAKTRVRINYTRCEPKSIWKPKTWFTCVHEMYRKTSHVIKPVQRLTTTYKNKDRNGPFTKLSDTSSFTTLPITGNPTGHSITVSTEHFGHVLIMGTWINIHDFSPEKNLTIPKVTRSIERKYLTLPFRSEVGVTQWHGYTAFQHPHTGIDFGVSSTPIFAPAHGTVVASGWDNTYGPCLSGGNILILSHSNGMHTTYFHLSEYNRSNGHTLVPGDSVTSGEKIGTTGNTGAWNCQSLGHHLHFETRTGRQQSTHTNPVPRVQVDWNKIPTLGWTTYPGRLTGDNPHPKF